MIMKYLARSHPRTPTLVGLTTLAILPLLVWGSTLAQSQKPISKDGLVEAIRLKGLSTKELVERIKTRGVSFEMTTEVEAQLRTAGARPEIVQAARANYRLTVGTLNVTATVAGTEITVSGNGSSIDRVTGMKLQPGRYDIVGRLHGYRTVTKQIEIKAGETSNIKLELDPLSTEETPIEESPKSAEPTPSRNASATELAFWDSIKNSTDPEDLKLYIKKYPSGAFVELANARLERFEQGAKEAEQKEASRRQAEEFARISVAGTTWQGTSTGRDKQYAFGFGGNGSFRMNLVYWGLQSVADGAWIQNGTELHITFANPKNGGMEATINGQTMEGEWHVPEKDNKIHTYRFIMQRVR